VKEAGFDALEIWQYHVSRLKAAEVEALAGRMDDLGMRAAALGAYPLLHLEESEAERTAAELDRLIDSAAALGARTFKIFPGRIASSDADAETRKRSVRRLKELAGKLDRRGLEMTMETHGNTLCDTLESTERLLGELAGEANVGICFQPYADQRTEAAIAMFERLRPAVRHVHLQNRCLSDRACTLLAEGDWIDYRRFLPHVRDSGFEGLLSLEFTAGLFPPEGADFDPQTVIDNASRDRAFAQAVWSSVQDKSV
jgi:sugar phosphate isomerase/epimerase